MPNKNPKFSHNRLLRFVYGGIGLILLALVISIPELINSDKDINNYTVAKEFLQEIVIAAMAASIWLSAKFYQRNLEQLKRIKALKADKGALEADLLDAIKHIGTVNVQLEAVHSALANIKNYPNSKSEFKNVLAFFASKLMTIANVDWLIIRLVDANHQRTIHEHQETRGVATPNTNIGNRQLLTKCNLDCLTISSEQDKLTIKAFCILPPSKLDKDKEELIKVILNQLEMIFIIYSSKYYKDS
jgi:hypothetical protein